MPGLLSLGLCSRDADDALENFRSPFGKVAELGKVALEAVSGLSSSSRMDGNFSVS